MSESTPDRGLLPLPAYQDNYYHYYNDNLYNYNYYIYHHDYYVHFNNSSPCLH